MLTTSTDQRTLVVATFAPSERLHIGHLLATIAPLLDVARQPHCDAVAFVADRQASLSAQDFSRHQVRTSELAATLIACGLGEHVALVRQSAVPAQLALLHRAEGTGADGRPVRVFAPAGSVVEMAPSVTALTSRTAERLRNLRIPAAWVGESAGDTDGIVHLLDEPTRIAATVRRAVTDLDPSLSYDPQLRPGVAALAQLLAALTASTPSGALVGLHGSSALKAAVTDALLDRLGPIQARYREVIADPAGLDRWLSAD